ncbi:MAG TPA: hypothetical protein ACFYD5_08420, partial [Candidatus Tripitaka sp. YC43]
MNKYFLLTITVVLVFIFGICLPFLWKWKFCEAPPETTIDLSSLLIVILGIAAIFAGGAYSLLSERVKFESAEAAKKEVFIAQAKV